MSAIIVMIVKFKIVDFYLILAKWSEFRVSKTLPGAIGDIYNIQTL
jgi:hypothetical protein